MVDTEGNVKPKAIGIQSIIDYLYPISAALIPGIFLLVIANRNYVEGILVFSHILIVTGILAAVSVGLFLLFCRVTHSIEGSLLIIGMFWLFFWLFSRLYSIITRFFVSLPEFVLTVFLLLLVAVAILCVRRLKPPFQIIRPAFNMLVICIIGLFAVNLAPVVSREVRLLNSRAAVSRMDEDLKPYRIKQDFNINPDLPQPDVHWIHVDGMMSIETAERFWNRDFEWFRNEMVKRGFIINPDESLETGYTRASLMALLSPTFYDSYFGDLINSISGELRDVKARTIVDEMAKAGLSFYEDIVPNYELFRAFMSGDYQIIIQDTDIFVNGKYYSQSKNYTFFDGFTDGDVLNLLSITTPLKFPDRHASARQPEYTSGNPSFVWHILEDTHMSNVWHQDLSVKEEDLTAVHLYPEAYETTAENLLTLIDTIRSVSPDAVIVVQSDHGFHLIETQQFLLEQGYSKEQVLELVYSVFSAVYIPEKYGGLDEPLSSLNISRELVNRFIGENYSLLPS